MLSHVRSVNVLGGEIAVQGGILSYLLYDIIKKSQPTGNHYAYFISFGTNNPARDPSVTIIFPNL